MQKRGTWPLWVIYILPLLLWMSVIFIMSTPTGSAANTSPVVHSIFQRLFPELARHMTPEQIDMLDVVIRKGAHITEYTILGLLSYRAFRYGRRDFHNRYPALTLLFGLLYASSDEYHQSFFASRGASPIDVLIDMGGVATATALSLWWHCSQIQKRLDACQESEENS